MLHIKKSTIILISFLTLAGILASCGKPESGGKPEKKSPPADDLKTMQATLQLLQVESTQLVNSINELVKPEFNGKVVDYQSLSIEELRGTIKTAIQIRDEVIPALTKIEKITFEELQAGKKVKFANKKTIFYQLTFPVHVKGVLLSLKELEAMKDNEEDLLKQIYTIYVGGIRPLKYILKRPISRL